MPSHAFAESEYFGATLNSKISASEHAEYPSATLGDAEVLSVKNSPPADIPDPLHLHEDSGEISSAVAGKQSRNILPNDISRLEFIYDPRHLVEETGPPARESGPLAGNAQVLAREPAAHDVNRGELDRPYIPDVRVLGHVGPAVGEDAPGGGVDLHLPRAPQPGPFKAEIKPAHAGEEASERHHDPTLSIRSSTPGLPRRWR